MTSDGERQIRQLREGVDLALRRGELAATIAPLGELARLESAEPRWPHRLGDALLRLGRTGEAVAAYEDAVDRYAALGFLTRAVAMAKVITGLDPSRGDVLERVDPGAARAVHRRKRPGGYDPDAAPEGGVAAAAPKLEPAADAASDEVRFGDADQERSIEVDLSEVELLEQEDRPTPVDPASLFAEAPPPTTASTLALLPVFPLFAEVPKDVLLELVGGATLVELDDGHVVVRTDEPADALFTIVEGRVQVTVPGLEDRRPIALGEGDVFGESCLLEGARRRADVVVDGRLSALRVPKDTLDAVAARAPVVHDLLIELLTRRLVANLFRTSSLFRGFPPEIRRELARMFEVRRADEGTVLVAEGKRSDGLYVLLQGRLVQEVGVARAAGAVDATLGAPDPASSPTGGATLGPGAIIGQRSLIEHSPAPVTLRAASELLLLRLPAARFMTLASGYPPVLERLAELAAEPTLGSAAVV